MSPPLEAALLALTIKAGDSVSNAVSCSPGGTLHRIYMPSGWDGDELLTFLISPDGVAFYPMFWIDNSQVAYRITPGTVVFTQPITLFSNNWVRVRSGSLDTPRKQSADRIFWLSMI